MATNVVESIEPVFFAFSAVWRKWSNELRMATGSDDLMASKSIAIRVSVAPTNMLLPAPPAPNETSAQGMVEDWGQ